jgi:hypothetical protein
VTLTLKVPRQLDKVNPSLWEVHPGDVDYLAESTGNRLACVGYVRGEQSKTESLLHHFVERGRDDIFD